MTLTLENLPPELDAALRQKAQEQQKTVGQVAVDAIKAGLSMMGGGPKVPDLGDIAGTGVEDPEFDAIMCEQDQVDPKLW